MVQAKAENLVQSTKESASAAADKANAAANTSGQTAEQNKEEAAGFLQQVHLISHIKFFIIGHPYHQHNLCFFL